MRYLASITLLIIGVACNGPKETYHAEVTGMELQDMQDLEIATFAGGCFWCTEAVFERVKGVENVISGYTGGTQKDPTYKQVSYGKTDHAEGIQLYFDPAQITYKELVEIFFATHDPTTLNRQGPDIGKQYRSAVYYHDDHQQQIIRAHIKELTDKGVYRDPIVTEVEPFTTFYPAEDYHQDYYQNNPDNPYIKAVAVPKVKKFEKQFKDKLKATS